MPEKWGFLAGSYQTAVKAVKAVRKNKATGLPLGRPVAALD
jgi:hypothetical protein